MKGEPYDAMNLDNELHCAEYARKVQNKHLAMEKKVQFDIEDYKSNPSFKVFR